MLLIIVTFVIMIAYNGGQYILDGKDLYLEYGFLVTSGKADFLKFPKAKERYSYSWPDENGTQYDLEEVPVFEDPQATLKGYIVAETEGEFLIRRYQLFTALRQVGLRTLSVVDISEDFTVFYIDNPISNLTIGMNIKGTNLKAWEMSITLQTVNYINDIINPEINVLGIDENTILGDTDNNILQIP